MLNSMDNAENVIALAGQMSAAFEGKKRDNGDSFRVLKSGAPEWMSDVSLAAHMDGAFFPMDWIYDKTENALDHIANLDAIGSDFDDAGHEYADSNVDLYNGELAAWLAENLQFGEYCDDAAREYGSDGEGIYRSIQLGQYSFLRDLFAAVLNALESVAEDMPQEESA